MENKVDYIPFGPEWEKEMMKWRKKNLVDWLREHMMMREINQNFLREFVMRTNMALPESEEDLKWFEEGINAIKNPEFIEQLFVAAGLGELKIKR